MATVFGIEDVKPLLGIETTKHDNVLAGIIAEAEAIVTARCGPLVSTSITKRLSPNAEGVLALPVYPIVSVESITNVESGVALTLNTEDFDLTAGLLEPDGLSLCEEYDVVFHAGRDATAAADLKRAVVELVRYLFRPTQGPNPAAPQTSLGDNMAGLRAAEMLMAPYAMVTI